MLVKGLVEKVRLKLRLKYRHRLKHRVENIRWMSNAPFSKLKLSVIYLQCVRSARQIVCHIKVLRIYDRTQCH